MLQDHLTIAQFAPFNYNFMAFTRALLSYLMRRIYGSLSYILTSLLLSTPAPEQPPPPTVTVGDGGFTIDGLGPMEVVVEYVCNYTSVITGETSQVRMKPNETADVSLEKVGGYIVQVRPQAMLIIAT